MIFLSDAQFLNDEDSIDMTDDGIETWDNDVNLWNIDSGILWIFPSISSDSTPSKTFLPTEITVERIVIFFKDEQPKKDFESINFTDEGIIILVSDEHPSKMDSEILVRFPVISRDLTPLKAFSPTEVIVDEIEICVRFMHPENANDSIEVTDDGIDMFVKDWQSRHIDFGIFIRFPVTFNDLTPWNAFSQTTISVDKIVIFDNVEHPANAPSSMIETDGGITICSKNEHLLNINFGMILRSPVISSD